jgi:ABC-type antimicrobial peptide transport system permease subunit
MRIRLDVCIGFIIAGIIITAIGVYAAVVNFPQSTWDIMGNKIPSSEWGWPFAIFGIILLLIGFIITYYRFTQKT